MADVEKRISLIVGESADSLSQDFPDIPFYDAEKCVCEFLQIEIPEGFEKIVIRGKEAEVEDLSNILLNYKFLDLVETAIAATHITAALISSNPIFVILGGLSLWVQAKNLSKITLKYEEAFIVFCLAKYFPESGAAIQQIEDCIANNIDLENTPFYSLDSKSFDVKVHLEALSGIKVVIRDNVVWRLSEQPIFRD